MPCGTEDYLPTILAALGVQRTGAQAVDPLDGVDLSAIIAGKAAERPRPLARASSRHVALIDNQYKLIRLKGADWMLFDIIEDPNETKDLAQAKPDVVAAMAKAVEAWQKSCVKSARGEDYPAAK